MLIAPERALHLLHQSAYCALATHAREPAGYPYPTVLPFACDTAHVPLILASALSEHARNLYADSRAGLVVFAGPDENVLSGARLTLVGEFLACRPSARTLARYLRYQPDAQRYLDLGDFAFYRLKLERMRYIGGFATMGWLTATDWASLALLDEEDEAAITERIEIGLKAEIALLGVDCFGADLRVHRSRVRVALDEPVHEADLLARRLMTLLTDYYQ
jgi:putative heme iron utilization protein